MKWCKSIVGYKPRLELNVKTKSQADNTLETPFEHISLVVDCVDVDDLILWRTSVKDAGVNGLNPFHSVDASMKNMFSLFVLITKMPLLERERRMLPIKT